MCIIVPSIIGAGCFSQYSGKNNKGRTASLLFIYRNFHADYVFLYMPKESTAIFYTLSGLTQFFFSDLIPQSMQLFQTVWNMGSGKPDLEMMVFSMHLFHLEIKSEWQLNSTFSRITWKMWLYCKSDTKCNCTFNYETCIYDDSRCTLDCDCGCIIFQSVKQKTL